MRVRQSMSSPARSLRIQDRIKESLPVVAACLVLFAALLTALIVVDRPKKEEREIERRKAAGQTISPTQYVAPWLYKGLKANLVLAGLLLVASPWLGGRKPQGLELQEMPQKPDGTGSGKWKVWACVGLMGVAAWHHAPRLFHGMWGDEEFNASRFILPQVERAKDGTLEIKERSWKTTLWSMRKPTNHLGYSALARLSHDTFFKPSNGPQDPFFSEALLRAPVYVAGLLMIPACIWALGVWGISGWWSVLLLMLHPWYLRFGVDGRGYGFMMLAVVLAIGAIGRALQTGQWRWWLLLSFLGFEMAWSNFLGLYPLAALHGAILAGLCFGGLSGEAKWFLAKRWLVCGVVSGMFMVGYLAPCLPQLIEYLAKHEIQGDWDMAFVKDVLSGWWFGQPWKTWPQPENPLRYGMDLALQGAPWMRTLGVGLWLGLLVAGSVMVWRKRSQWALAAFCFGAPAVMVAHMLVSHSRPYDWYFSPYIPGALALIGVAGTWVGQRKWGKVVMSMLVVVYGLMTHHARQVFREHAVEDSRSSVASYREVTNPRHPDIEKDVISGGFVMFTEGYDPALRRFQDVTGLKALMEEADRSGKKLFVNVGNLDFVRRSDGTRDITALLEDGQHFELSGVYHGLLPFTTRHVFRYKGSGDAGALPEAP